MQYCYVTNLQSFPYRLKINSNMVWKIIFTIFFLHSEISFQLITQLCHINDSLLIHQGGSLVGFPDGVDVISSKLLNANIIVCYTEDQVHFLMALMSDHQDECKHHRFFYWGSSPFPDGVDIRSSRLLNANIIVSFIKDQLHFYLWWRDWRRCPGLITCNQNCSM